MSRGGDAPEGTTARQTDQGGRAKAVCPDGIHPFEYLTEGHAFLYSGLLLLEERDDLEDAEIEAIRDLLKPYRETLEQFNAIVLSGGSGGEP